MQSPTNDSEIIIIDYGSQFTQLIARKVREAGVFSRIISCYENMAPFIQSPPAAFILSGGPASTLEKGAPSLNTEILKTGKPILGICYGMQLITLAFGGKIAQSQTREYGPAKMEMLTDSPLWKNIDKNSPTLVWMSHGDHVAELPPGFTAIGKTANLDIAAMANPELKIYCLQFHPEVHHSADGFQMLQNFLFQIVKIKPGWNMASFIDKSIIELKEQIGKDNVICAISGGVDSSVTAALLNKAIGNQLYCIFVDNGLLRKDETNRVTSMLREYFNLQIKVADASEIFLKRLENITDPEQKRKIIGHTFIEIFNEEAKKIPNAKFLAQGTLYPDVIESTSPKGPSAVIKSHHNVGGLPENINFKLVEPLRELFKDEVRKLGLELGMPESMIWRQPFPGPGLAIRILGPVTRDKLAILRKADEIIQEELRSSGWERKIWQGFAVLLPLNTVGVMGDARTYENVIAFRCVESIDAMTADWTKLPYDVLATVSTRIINEVPGINRVVYDISSKPPSTIEWE